MFGLINRLRLETDTKFAVITRFEKILPVEVAIGAICQFLVYLERSDVLISTGFHANIKGVYEVTSLKRVCRIIGRVKLSLVGGMLLCSFGIVNASENGMVPYECDNYAQAAIKPFYNYGKTFERWMVELEGYHQHTKMPIDPVKVAVTASVYSVSNKADKISAYRVAYNVCESMYSDPLKVAKHD